MSYCRQCGALLTPENTRAVDGRVFCADCAAKVQPEVMDFTAPRKGAANENVTQGAYVPPVQQQTPPSYTPPVQPAAPMYQQPPMRRMRTADPNKWAKIVRGMAITMMVIGVIMSIVLGISVIAGGAIFSAGTADLAREFGLREQAVAASAASALSGIMIMIFGSAFSILSQASIMMIATMALDVNEIKQEVMTINDKH